MQFCAATANAERERADWQMVIYNTGIHISVAGPSDGADLVFEKIAELFRGLGVREPISPPVKFYRSTIICDFDKPIETLFAAYEKIAGIIEGKGCLPEAKMHTNGISFSADPSTIPPSMAVYNPTLFTISRKVDVGFAINCYSCFANMATADHFEAITRIESLL